MKPTPQLQRLAADMVVLCADPGDLPCALDLLAASYATPAAEAARARLRADPAIAPLIAERYWGPWPDPATPMAICWSIRASSPCLPRCCRREPMATPPICSCASAIAMTSGMPSPAVPPPWPAKPP